MSVIFFFACNKIFFFVSDVCVLEVKKISWSRLITLRTIHSVRTNVYDFSFNRSKCLNQQLSNSRRETWHRRSPIRPADHFLARSVFDWFIDTSASQCYRLYGFIIWSQLIASFLMCLVLLCNLLLYTIEIRNIKYNN